MIVGGASSAWADETYILGWGTASGTSGTYTNFTVTSGSVTDIVSFTTAKNSSSTTPAYNSSNNELRLYYNSGGNGGSITLTPATGITITGFVMTTSTTPSVKYTVDGGNATSVSASNNTYTVTGISATSSLTIQNVNTSNTQLRIKTIAITYTSSSTPTYAVTYDGNGATSGSVPEDDNEYGENDEVTVLGNTGSLAKTGYTFDGWNTKDDGKGTTYSAGGTFEITADVTLYAKWNAKTAAGLAYETTSYNVFPGASFDTPTLTNPYSLGVSYSSSNTSVATVDVSTGAVTVGTTEGTATITASSSETNTYAAGSASYTITVAKGTTTVILSDDSWTANILDGATKELTATAKYSETTLDSPAITWSSSNTSVATVSGGVVTPVAPGSATIRASYAGTTTYASSYADCAVTVNKANTTLTLNEDEIEQDLKDGRSFALTPTVKASKSDDSKVTLDSPTVTWSSSDETVATVSGGVVTGLKAGTTTITASYAGGDLYNAATNATCSVTLTDTRTGVSISSFTAAKTTLVIGDEQATIIANDQAGWAAAYTYSSSDEDVATVDENGVITAVAKGTATITATINISLSETGYKEGTTTSKTLDITVTKPFHTVTFWVNGDETRTASVEEDQAITFPTAVETTPGDEEFPKVINGQTFQGWYTEEYSNASVAPSYVNTASKNMGDDDVTYYAVYADVEEDESDDVEDCELAQTLQYDTWSYSGSTTDKTNYRLFHKDSYIESASFDLSKLIKVVVKGGTFGGSDNNSLTIGDGTNTWKSVTVTTNGGLGDDTYTDGFALSGTNKLRITSNSGTTSGTGSGVRIKEVKIYVKGTVTTKSNYTTDNRSAAGISYANATMDVKLSSGSAGQALSNPNSLSGITYSSSDATVATVNSSTGAVTALLKAGETTITATFAGNSTYKPAEVSYTLNVTEKTPHGLAYADDAVEKLTTDAAFTNTLTNGYSLTVSYSSSETGVATVNASTGEVTIKGAGETTITASFAGNGDYEAGNASYTLTVSKATPTLSFASANAIGREGEDFSGNALTNPATLTVSYSSSDTNVATVNSTTGAVTIVAAGTTTITASFAGNDTYTSGSASYTLKVLDTPTITVSNQTIAWGETFTYSAGGSDTGGDITVTSRNTSIATVDGLVITPVACGEVEITVRRAENDTYKAGEETFTLTITAPAGKTSAKVTMFEETFASSTGGPLSDWGGSEANGTLKTDNKSWTTTNGSGAGGCAKFGTSGSAGSATTPSITVENGKTYTLSFKAAPWSTDASKTITVTVTGGSINSNSSATTSSMSTKTWNSFNYDIVASSTSMSISFACSANRFFLDDVKVEKETASTTVTLNKDGYATYCSVNPIDFSSTEGYTAWRVSNIDESGVITFTKITEKIKGGQGVLLYNKNADHENTSTATIKFADGTTEFTSSENLLVGTTAPTFVEQEVDDYYTNFVLSSKYSDFRIIKDGGMTVPANKAYLPVPNTKIPAAEARLTFVFEDDQTTTIQGVSVRKTAPDTYYNMKGQRVDNPKKGGIYVKNGKKVIFK